MEPARVHSYLVESRERVFGWVRPLTDGSYRSEHPIGLGSLARTLHHTMAAEWCYMRRVVGVEGPIGPVSREHDPEIGTADALAFVELEGLWREQAAETASEIAAVGDWGLVRTYTTDFNGAPYVYRASAGDVFTQLVTHEVHHRAQALNMLRRLGVETGEIDYNTLMYQRVES